MTAWLEQLDPNLVSDLWIVGIAAATNVACALVGCFLVLRRMSLMGDAMSHAVLPGLVVAFILSGSLQFGFMFLGALAAGLLTSVLTETLHRRGGVSEDASMGVVFTALFALGVVLIKRYGSNVHLDTDAVLSGLLELTDQNVVRIAGYDVPRALVSIGPVLLLNLAVIVVFWKELLLSSFDPALATTMGFRAGWMHYLLMTLVALTAVASFEQVGSILVIAMLIVPGATAHLLTDRLGRMLWLAAGVAVATAVAGQIVAVQLNVNTAGAMAVVVGLFYALAVVFSPRYGLVSRSLRQASQSLRIVEDDILGMLYRLEELAAPRRLTSQESLRAVGGGLLGRLALVRLVRRRWIARDADTLQLTDAGRGHARQLVRSHRLWEMYLVEQLGLPLDHVHEPAHRVEHYIDERLQAEIAAAVTTESTDPHGREIPSSDA